MKSNMATEPDYEQFRLRDELNSLFRRFCWVNGVNLNEPLAPESLLKISAVIDAIDDGREEEDKCARETIDDARNSGCP